MVADCRGVHVAINSAVGYERPRQHLLASLAAANVPMDQVHVFVANSAKSSEPSSATQSGRTAPRMHPVAHNSFDFSGLIHIVENPRLFGTVSQVCVSKASDILARHCPRCSLSAPR
jgi:hypothetical protein